MSDEQPGLFDLPAERRPPPRMAASPAAGRYRFARYKPRIRTLCAQCIRLIHALGPSVAPLPQPVRWRVTRGPLTEDYCEQHKRLLEGK